jgi:hypothetical protein
MPEQPRAEQVLIRKLTFPWWQQLLAVLVVAPVYVCAITLTDNFWLRVVGLAYTHFLGYGINYAIAAARAGATRDY